MPKLKEEILAGYYWLVKLIVILVMLLPKLVTLVPLLPPTVALVPPLLPPLVLAQSLLVSTDVYMYGVGCLAIVVVGAVCFLHL